MRLSKPWAVSLADDRPFAFGGIWDRWKGEDKDKNEIIVESFSIITTDPNEVLEPFHNRCPLIIEPKDYEPWLAPAEPSHLPIDLVRTYPTSTSARSLFPVAPPVNGLDVFRMVVPPRSSHATGIDVVGDNVGVVGELFIADTAFAFLGHNLLVQQLSHFRIRAYLPITARMLEVVNATDSQLALTPFSRDRFPAAAELRTVNRAKLVSTEFHGFLQFVFGVSAGSDEWWRCFALIQVSRQKRGNRIKFPCADPPWLGAVGVKSGYATAWRSGPLTPTSVTSESSPNTRGIYNRPKSPTKADPEFFYSVHLATENNC